MMQKEFWTFVLTFLLTLNVFNLAAQKGVTEYSIDLRTIVRLPLQLKESSGIAIENPNKIWTHNDSGNTNELFAIDTLGEIVKTLKINNIDNIDWEDLAMDTEGNIYINDAGNNDNDRKNLAIHMINPVHETGGVIEAQSINFTFEDQTAFPPPNANKNFDIEAIVWANDTLFLFTKNRSNPFNGYSKVYRLPAQPGNQIARLSDSVFLGSSTSEARVTAATLNVANSVLALLTSNKIIVFRNFSGTNFFSGQSTVYRFSAQPGQVEAIDHVTDNTYYITSEGSNSQAGFLYEADLTGLTGIWPKNEHRIGFSTEIRDDVLYLKLDDQYVNFELIQLFSLSGVRIGHYETVNSIPLYGFNTGILIINAYYRGNKHSQTIRLLR
jgi:hypothetical protein